MNGKLGEGNVINQKIHASNGKPTDGRIRYSEDLRRAMYSHLIGVIRKHNADLPVALCMEEPDLWKATGLQDNCNCLL